MDKPDKGSGPPIADDVQRAITSWFAKNERADVVEALNRCRPGRDVARVHRVILAMSRGSVREVERLVEIANEDHRDLIRMPETGHLSKQSSS